ncbi:hypothetical protein J2X31_001280 [Flavobacterium arsenatis]|uniref:Uncharacterized protein n=1 Tax=Flavobacterium arsenatis TaxID=1484332 RepID=A0ABU1TMT4_9FLAO|nr:hypothetical protein [Flavobacterium arsenatis]
MSEVFILALTGGISSFRQEEGRQEYGFQNALKLRSKKLNRKNLNIIFGINEAFSLNFHQPLVPYTPQNL